MQQNARQSGCGRGLGYSIHGSIVEFELSVTLGPPRALSNVNLSWTSSDAFLSRSISRLKHAPVRQQQAVDGSDDSPVAGVAGRQA